MDDLSKESEMTFLRGRISYKIPDYLKCPDCGNDDFLILSLRKWNELYSNQKKNEVINNFDDFLCQPFLLIDVIVLSQICSNFL